MMKHLFVGLSLVATFCVHAAQPVNIYQEFLISEKKEDFLKEQINSYSLLKEVLGYQRCAEVVKFKTIKENNFSLVMQVSCRNVKDDLHFTLKKPNNTLPIINTCEEAAKEVNESSACRAKL